MKNLSQDNILKITLTLFFLLTICAIINYQNSAISSYTISLYEPILPFILLMASLIAGILIFIIISNNKTKKIVWLCSLILIILNSLIMVLLPYIRGYIFSSSGDHIDHIGFAQSIINTGHQGIVYPLTHILISQISLISNIKLIVLANFIGPLFFLLFILFSYILSREIISKESAIFAILACFGVMCFYYTEIFPVGYASILFPFLFYLMVKSLKEKSKIFTLLFIIEILALVFLHLVAGYVFLLILLISIIFDISYIIFIRFKGHENSNISLRLAMTFPILLLIILILWSWYNMTLWNYSVTTMISWSKGELLSSSILTSSANSFDILGLNSFEIIMLFVKKFGNVFLLFILSIYAIIEVFNIKNKSQNSYFFSLYSVIFLCVSLIWIIDYIRPLLSLSSGRFITFESALFPPLVGFALYSIMAGKFKSSHTFSQFFPSIHKTGKILMVFVISVCVLIGFAGLYPSPSIYEPNPAVSYHEVSSIKWMLEKGDPAILIHMDRYYAIEKFVPVLIQPHTNTNNYPISKYPVQWNFEFGSYLKYSTFQNMSSSFGKNKYLILRKEVLFDIHRYIYPKMPGFTDYDNQRMKMDSSLDLLYNNGEEEISHIR